MFTDVSLYFQILRHISALNLYSFSVNIVHSLLVSACTVLVSKTSALCAASQGNKNTSA